MSTATCRVENSKGERCGRAVTFWIAEELCAGHRDRMVTHGTFDADRPIRQYTKSELVRAGHPLTPGATSYERFLNRVHKTARCWIWTGTVLNTGYGQCKNRGVNTTAHRFAWEIAFGAIPKGARIRQTCDNRLCVKPAHLEMVGGSIIKQQEAA
jgi:hypothetical protein